MSQFKLPEDLKATADEDLKAAVDTALDEYNTLKAIDEAEITDEQIARLEELVAGVETIRAEQAERETARRERAARLAAAKGAIADEEPADEAGAEEPVDEPVDAEENDPEQAEAEAEKEKEPVLASGQKRSLVASATKKPIEDVAPVVEKPRAALVAAAGIPGVEAGAELVDLDAATDAFMARMKSMPKGRIPNLQRRENAFAIRRPELPTVDLSDVAGTMKTLGEVTNERNLEGGSLVAAGAWCAPSETMYELMSWETISGILDLPTVQVNRGGINFTKGPDFGTDIYGNANFGFLQTEAQIEADTVKPFLLVECQDFEDVRLDAIGFGLKAKILTESAYPELIRRYLEGTIVAHQHKVNASVISRVVTALGAASNFSELGSVTGDTLEAIEIAVMSLRYKYRLDPKATVEGFAPVWLLGALRADFARRNGVELTNVTDQVIAAHFATRGVRLQYVYDWAGQDMVGTEIAWPGSVRIALYPAGTFVKGTSDVISLDAMYDSADLAINTYTAAFMEEGLLVANMYGNGRLFEIGVNTDGATGFPAIGAGAGVTIP